MKLPPEIKRAMDRLERAALDSNDPESIVPVASDLLSELRRYEKKLEEATKDIDAEHPGATQWSHALRRVTS